MKSKIVAVASVLAIMAATPSFAASEAESAAMMEKTQPAGTGNIETDAKKAWKDIKADTKEAYEDIKARFLSDEANATAEVVTIDSRKTVNGMIGKTVMNGKEESVGTLKDIILDKSGNVLMVVVADGEIAGFEGKLVALDYNYVSVRSDDGDVMAPISEEAIDKAAAFSYEPKDKADNVRVIPEGGISTVALLDGKLVNEQLETVADIDNIALKNGRASDLIVGFDKVLGLGGEKLALAFKDAQLVQTDDGYQFKLTANQAAQFEAYKKAASN